MKTATTSEPRKRQEELGQFLTAAPVADFMASMFGPLPGVVRLLDAGAGAGALTSAFVSRLCERDGGVRAVEATLYELDPLILDALSSRMRDCQRVCTEAGIRFTFTISSTDFIQEISARLAGDLFGAPPPAFDAAIANPPYRKISTDSAERRALRALGVETSNLYTGFISLPLETFPILDFRLLRNPRCYQKIDLLTSRGCPFHVRLLLRKAHASVRCIPVGLDRPAAGARRNCHAEQSSVCLRSDLRGRARADSGNMQDAHWAALFLGVLGPGRCSAGGFAAGIVRSRCPNDFLWYRSAEHASPTPNEQGAVCGHGGNHPELTDAEGVFLLPSAVRFDDFATAREGRSWHDAP
jgi:hypothetical protein